MSQPPAPQPPVHTGGVDLGQLLAEQELQDPDGKPVRLGSLWADRSVVLVFVRHFG